jgi:hypothetical protein
MDGSEEARLNSGAGAGWRVVADAAAQELEGLSDVIVRSQDEEELRAAVEAAWGSSRWLPLVGSDTVLRTVGRLLGQLLSEPEDAGSGVAVRGYREFEVTRPVMRGLDTLVGAVLSQVAGRFNHYVRSQLAPGVSEFLGDVFVYQRHRNEIHQRVLQTLHEHAPGYGSKDRPVAIVGHSLGGVIAFDFTVAGKPRVWATALVTFGSQAPFFHVLDPRGADLPAYAIGQPVQLPPTIRRWVNLWEPLDPLAFIASRVFKLEDGQPPADVPLRHLASAGLWTHSVYWTLGELVDVVRRTLESAETLGN